MIAIGLLLPLMHTREGVVLRLVGMASDRLRRALRAVPDDIKTRHALADAYQVRLLDMREKRGKREENIRERIL